MKNKFFIIAAIIIAVTAITIVSCKKDKTEESNPSSENIAKNYELSDMDKAMIAFGEKMKTASSEKSGETLPIVEALNTLTNYQNFSMCDASNYSIEMQTDTVHALLNVEEGEVLLSELNRFYEATKQEILFRLNTLGHSQSTLFCIVTTIDGNSRENLDSMSGNLAANVIVRIFNPNPIRDYNPIYDTTLSWYDFDGGGLCDCGNEGQYLGWDCVRVINARLHTGMTIACGQGYQTYYTNIHMETVQAIDYVDSSSPNGYYALPWRSFWDNAQCVSPSDMAYYINKFLDAFADKEDYYLQPIFDFQIAQGRCIKEENFNKEAVAFIRLGDINCKPILPDD